MHHMKMKPSGDNCQEHSSRSMHNAEETAAHQLASKMNACVHNSFVLMLPVAIVWLIVLPPKVHHAVMVR
jgi:hypothetical protein